MIDHAERYQLAVDLTVRIVKEYPVVVGGLYGSTARGTDTPWSDVELWFVVENNCPDSRRFHSYKGTAVTFNLQAKTALESTLQNPGAEWPFTMGLLSVLQVLYGNSTHVQAWLEMGQSVKLERFYRFIQTELHAFVLESYGRVHSCAFRENRHDLFYAVAEVLIEMKTVLCLLNQRWVTRDYTAGLLQSAEFPKVPQDYRELVTALLESHDFSDTLSLVDRLVENYYQLLSREGLVLNDYQTVSEIPLG